MKTPDILTEQPKVAVKRKRVDLKFEQIIIHCAVGCLINDIPMSDTDYVRMELAFSRLLSKQQ